MTRKAFITAYFVTLVVSVVSLLFLSWLLLQALNKNTELNSRNASFADQLKVAQESMKRFETRQADAEAKQADYDEIDNKYANLLVKHEELEAENTQQLAKTKELLNANQELKSALVLKLNEQRDTLAKEEARKIRELKSSFEKEKEKLSLEFNRKKEELTRAAQAEAEKANVRNQELEKTLSALPLPPAKKNTSGASERLPLPTTGEMDRLKKENAIAHYNLGVIYLKSGNYDLALKELQRSLKLNPNDPLTHYNLARIYETDRKDFDKAVEHYQAYLRLDPRAKDGRQVEEQLLKLRMRKEIGVDGVLKVSKS